MPLLNQNKMVASVSSGHTAVSTGPNDICKTPAPPAPAPIPLPYPNVAATITPGPGYTTKTLVMGTSMFTKKSKIALSNGDQAGVALGIMSNKIMGTCEVIMASNDVFAEGGAVVRSFDSTDSNGLLVTTNKALGTALMAGGALTPASEKPVVCTAFRDAVDKWCKLTPEERAAQRNFNDYFFAEMNKTGTGKAIAEQMTREVGGLFGRGGTFQGFIDNLVVSKDKGAASKIAQAMRDAQRRALRQGAGHGAAQGAAREAAWAAQGVTNPTFLFKKIGELRRAKQTLPGWMLGKLRRAKFYPRFADAMYQGRVFEIKGPGDKFHGAQARDAVQMGDGQTPFVVSCESCELQCRSGCPVGPVKPAS